MDTEPDRQLPGGTLMATQYTAGLTAGQVLTAATMNSIGAAWETWTPTLTASTTNPTLGTGSTATGRYGRVNKIVHGNAQIQFGTAGVAAGSGNYFVSLPVTAQANGVIGGTWQAYDSSTLTVYFGSLVLDTTSRVILYYNNPASFVTNATPWTWAASDFIRVWFTYEAA
jgi:hypothetical protein